MAFGEAFIPETRQSIQLESPLISIITVVFNGAGKIEETIQSFLAQDRRSCEFIVIDGASTDETLQILARYSSVIDCLVSEPDKGIYDAMNKGLRRAHGEWIYYLNCGDRLAGRDVLSEVSKVLRTSRSPLVVGYVLATENGVVSAKLPVQSELPLSARTLFNTLFCHQALFIRRTSYLEGGGFDITYRTFADFKSAWSIVQRYEAVQRIDLPIAYFALDGASSNFRNSLQLYREAERLFEEFGERKSKVVYLAGALRAIIYRYKRALLEKF